MKNSMLALAVGTFIAGTLLTSCNTPAEKVEKAQDNVTEAKKDLADAKRDYMADVENYRKETEITIRTNEEVIADFKTKAAKEKKAVRADYEKQIAVLEQKNADMKLRLKAFNADSKEHWEKFRTEFGADMNNLGKAQKEFTIRDKK